MNTYETKCRRCGHIIKWDFEGSQADPDKNFTHRMGFLYNNVEENQCLHCKMKTIQDLVSHSERKFYPHEK